MRLPSCAIIVRGRLASTGVLIHGTAKRAGLAARYLPKEIS